MNIVRVADVNSGVSYRVKSALCRALEYLQHALVVETNVLIIGVNFDAEQPRVLDEIENFIDILAVGVNCSRVNYTVFSVQLGGKSVDALNLTRDSRNGQNHRIINSRALHTLLQRRKRALAKRLYIALFGKIRNSLRRDFIGECVGVKIYYHFKSPCVQWFIKLNYNTLSRIFQ